MSPRRSARAAWRGAAFASGVFSAPGACYVCVLRLRLRAFAVFAFGVQRGGQAQSGARGRAE
eukprot:7853774-Alexandrium_andersonii.AAC.1